MSLHRQKLVETMLFIGSHHCVRELGMTKLYKLIYFADVAHLRDHGRSITGSEYIKYQHGPVPSRGEKIIKELRRENRLHTEQVRLGSYAMTAIKSVGKPGLTELSESELSTLDAVCNDLGAETASALSERSHEEPAWIAAKMLDKLSPELMMYGAAEDPDGL